MGIFNWFGKKTSPSAQNQTQQSTSASPISILGKEIAGLGHPEYPFLSKQYSPSSRVPCQDFSAFIIDRLNEDDRVSIKSLMRHIIEGNPGIGCGTDWIDATVDEMINAPIEDYISFKDRKALLELKAIWIIAGKSGGKRQWWITDRENFMVLLSRALCAYHFEPKSNIDRLIPEANQFINKLAEEIPFWKDYPKFNKSMMNATDPGESECRQKIRSLSVGARLHLFQFIGYGKGAEGLLDVTDFATKNMGLYISTTSEEIMESNLVLPDYQNHKGLSSIYEKNDLIRLCTEKGADYRKSWNKNKLVEALAQKDSEFIESTLMDRAFVRINPAFSEDLMALSFRSEQLVNLFKVLCFA